MKYLSEALHLQVFFNFNFNLLNSSQNQLKIKGFKELYFVEKFKNRLEANAYPMQYLNGNIHPYCVAKIAHFEQSSTLMTDVGDDQHPKKSHQHNDSVA